jgi:hypothetical protein
MTDALILKRASASRPSGEWNEDDYDVLADSGAGIRRASRNNLLRDHNHFVRGKDNVCVLRGRALSRLEIDDQLEFHGLLDWQVAAFSPLRIDAA